MSLRFAATVSRGSFTLRADDRRSSPARCSPCSVRTARARARCCARSPACSPSTPATITLDGRRRRRTRRAACSSPPEQRGLGVVFQDHRLFPHLRVVDNVAFGPRSRGASRAAARAAAMAVDRPARSGRLRRPAPAPAVRRAGPTGRAGARARLRRRARCCWTNRWPRSTCRRGPRCRASCASTWRRTTGPTLLVTHDPVEALVLADRIVVLEDGVVVQQGTPAEISSRPVTPYVAQARRGEPLPRHGDRGDGRSSTAAGGCRPPMRRTDPCSSRCGRRRSPCTPSGPHPSSARIVWPGDRAHARAAGRPDPAHRRRASNRCSSTSRRRRSPSSGSRPGAAVWLTAKATDVATYPDVAR